MKLFWHFVKRDVLDFRIGWGLLVVMHAILLFTRPPLERLSWMWWIYLMFAIFYTSGVWNSGAGVFQGINRTSLRALPIRRRTMFLLSVLRCVVGTIPLGIYLFCVRADCATFFSVVWLSTFGTDLYLVGLLTFGAVFLAISNTSDTLDMLQRAVGRWFRMRVVLVMMFEGMFGMALLIVWVIAGCGLLFVGSGRDVGIALGAMGIALAYFSLLGWRRYQQWCWD